MTKTSSSFNVKTEEDCASLLRELEKHGLQWASGTAATEFDCWTASGGGGVVIYVRDSHITYFPSSVAQKYADKPVQEFTAGMKIVKAPADSNEQFLAVGQGDKVALQKIEELEAKLVELKAMLIKPAEPLYRVVLPNPNSKALFVIKKNGEGTIILQRIPHSKKDSAYTLLTEAEIKEDFEWAWTFAERVA